MGIGSGLDSSLGVAAESVYGTYVAPSKFLIAKSYDLQPKRERVQGEGIQKGALGPLAAHYAETTTAAEGTIDFDVQTSSLGLILQSITGGTSTSAQQAASAAYLQTHTLGSTVGKSLTAQIGRPTRGGTAVPLAMLGAKVTSADFKAEVKGELSCNLSLDGRALDNTTALATPTYTGAPALFTGAQMQVKMGAFGSEAAVSGVRSVSQKWARNLDVEGFAADGTGLKGEPVENGLVDITGTLSVDWLAKATFEDLSWTTATTSLVWVFTGALIASTYYRKIEFTLPSVTFEPGAQGVSGRNELTADWNYTWRYDGTNLPTIKYTTVDTAL